MKILLTAGIAVFLTAGAALNAAPSFTHEIPFELGASGFADGDKITITSVRGDRKHIEAGGSYIVEGTYTLNSAESA
ncbi:MAG TPA: hypothetical protein VGN61_00245, partial [Verrucomicrobiae bacterium]